MKRISPKKVAVFTDKRPGHEKQTQAIIRQLEKYADLNITTVECSKPDIIHQVTALVAYLLKKKRGDSIVDSTFDLLIGTGTHTHIPMLQCKRAYGVPAITCMTPMFFLIDEFDLVFSPVHDNVPERVNVFSTLGPPSTNEDQNNHLDERVLILIGGLDNSSHHWDSDQLIADIRNITDTDMSKKYIVSTSPRTPSETLRLLADLAREYPCITLFPFEKTSQGWVESEYQSCKHVWVTADSISMVYEAVSSGCRVGLIPVKWKKPNNKFYRSQDFLRKKGYVTLLDEYLTNKQFNVAGTTLAEARKCAEEVIRRLSWRSSI